jgi:dihydroorotase-like cyclic amidohydrolase
VLQPGSIADIAVVDLEATATIEGAKLHSKAKHTPFESWQVQGLPTHTIVNGQLVYREGEILGRAGGGRWVPSHRGPSAIARGE